MTDETQAPPPATPPPPPPLRIGHKILIDGERLSVLLAIPDPDHAICDGFAGPIDLTRLTPIARPT
jgi:hypothetical protein